MLMEVFLISIAGYGLAIAFEIFRASFDAVYEKTNFKPFNCRICLTFWSSLIISISLGHDLINSVVYSFFSVTVAYLLKMLEES